MTATAAEASSRAEQALGWAEEALGWAEQCITYTTARNDEHELAHALLTRNTLVSDPALEELEQVADAFRAVGDLHCLTRTYLRMADVVSNDQALGRLRQAASIAHVARHVGREAEALDRLIRVSWTTGQHHAAAVALGELGALVGDSAAMARCARRNFADRLPIGPRRSRRVGLGSPITKLETEEGQR